MNFKDRGNKKWTAMMLIEHRKRLKELKESEKDMNVYDNLKVTQDNNLKLTRLNR